MKRIVRLNTFETNSSSSHSLVITKRTESVMKYFPKNSDEVFELTEYGVAYCHEYGYEVNVMYNEVDKARFMLNVIAGHIEAADDYDDENHYPEVSYWVDGDWEKGIKNTNRTFEMLIKQKPFVWLKELLEERTGTKFEFVKPDVWGFPYYRQAYDSNYSLDEAIGINWFDENEFKKRMAEIIFDDDIIIKDSSEGY